MRIHSQSLGEGTASKFWQGRLWLYFKKRYEEAIRLEWYFGKYAKGFSATVSFGGGDSDSELQLHVCLPFLFSIYLSFSGVIRCHEIRCGIAIHSESLWVYIFDNVMESRSNDPWYRKVHCLNFPWQLDWYSTEVLQHKAKEVAELSDPVWRETKSNRSRLGDGSFEARQAVEKTAQETYPYIYDLKSGKRQYRTAAVHIVRMIWKARWYPIIWRVKTSTSIDVKFSDEVGERTGSWKGGCIGCGCEMLSGETPLETLRRMERERKF